MLVWLVSSAASLFSAMHGSLVTSSLVRETTRKREPRNYGYKFGQEKRPYNIGGGPRLTFRSADLPVRPLSTTGRSLHFLLATWRL